MFEAFTFLVLFITIAYNAPSVSVIFDPYHALNVSCSLLCFWYEIKACGFFMKKVKGRWIFFGYEERGNKERLRSSQIKD